MLNTKLEIKKDFKKLMLNNFSKINDNLNYDNKNFKFTIIQNDDYYTKMKIRNVIETDNKKESESIELYNNIKSKKELEFHIIEDIILMKYFDGTDLMNEFSIKIPYEYYDKFSEKNYYNLIEYITTNVFENIIKCID